MGLGLGNIANDILRPFGRKIVPERVLTSEQRAGLDKQLEELKKNLPADYPIFKQERIEIGKHEAGAIDTQCGYMAGIIAEKRPENIVDFGSYRHFICGLAAAYKISTVDVRDRKPSTSLETVITADCTSVPMIEDESYDLVLSQQLLQHPGLGRYGDALDAEGHIKTIEEWKRITKPGGYLLFSTTLNSKHEALVWNCHRIYTQEVLHTLCKGLTMISEVCCPRGGGAIRAIDEATDIPSHYDYYIGLWQKPL